MSEDKERETVDVIEPKGTITSELAPSDAEDEGESEGEDSVEELDDEDSGDSVEELDDEDEDSDEDLLDEEEEDDEDSDDEDDDLDDEESAEDSSRESWPHEASKDTSGASRFSNESDSFKQQRKRLESTLRDVFRKAIERGVDAGVGAIEQSVDVIERSMEVGRGRVKSANSALRDVIDEVKIPKDLPKDLAGAVLGQLEEGKNVLVGAVAKEVRSFLDDTDVAFELQRVLTSISFEISTEIRFVPNERGIPRAEVSSKARPKVSARRARKRRREDENEED